MSCQKLRIFWISNPRSSHNFKDGREEDLSGLYRYVPRCLFVWVDETATPYLPCTHLREWESYSQTGLAQNAHKSGKYFPFNLKNRVNITQWTEHLKWLHYHTEIISLDGTGLVTDVELHTKMMFFYKSVQYCIQPLNDSLISVI